jgi:hypothetical protein
MTMDKDMESLIIHTNAFPLRELAIERGAAPGGGFQFAVWVHGKPLREKRHQNVRWFANEDAALRAGGRARR